MLVAVSAWALLAFVLASLAPPSRAQIGSDCSDIVPCTGIQECSLGYCRCPEGYVKLDRDCLPEKAFNETCQFDDQCVDFRLKCSEGRCACIKYFHWDEYSKQCLTYKDLKYMLTDMEEKYDTSGWLSAETNLVFTGMMWTGLAVMIIGLLLASGCLFYGCCYERLCCRKGDKLSASRLASVDSGEPTPRTQETIVPGSTHPGCRGASQGTGVDYIPALYETTSFDII